MYREKGRTIKTTQIGITEIQVIVILKITVMTKEVRKYGESSRH